MSVEFLDCCVKLLQLEARTLKGDLKSESAMLSNQKKITASLKRRDHKLPEKVEAGVSMSVGHEGKSVAHSLLPSA